MTQINYLDYKHSYAHAMQPILKKLNYLTNVKKVNVKYLQKVILQALNNSEVRFTEKEHEFFDNVCNHYNTHLLYYYVRNCINKAKETLVYVDDNGELI
jgi:hypothetical protein